MATTRTLVPPATTDDRGGNGDRPAPARPRQWRRRHGIPAAVALVAGAATIAIVAGRGGNSSPTASSATTVATTLAQVSRRDLVVTEQVAGTLQYGTVHPAVNRHAGVVTTVAPNGTVVDKGQVLYAVDGRPTVLMFGDTPAYRALSTSSSDGPDVQQLEQNLVDLGFASPSQLTVDDHFSVQTATAVKAWQASLGLTQDGVVQLGDVIFLPGAVRVDHAAADVGTTAQNGAQVLGLSATDKQVTASLTPTVAQKVHQ